jgi:hypothetical protein
MSVERFANAGPPADSENEEPALFWLAGLLEGEGSFLRPIPSSPSCPVISCRMTDRDVVQLVAAIFVTSIQANSKADHKTEFATLLRGARAVELMRLLQPMLSERRQAAIGRALDGYRTPVKKLNFDLAKEIRSRRQAGDSISSLARSYFVSRPTIRAVLKGRFYPTPNRDPAWLSVSRAIEGVALTGTELNWKELYWLAGWLEGEGSFSAPPPSSPRCPRIQATCQDADVIAEVSRLLRVTPTQQHRRGSLLWRVLLRGKRAVTLMNAIRPAMGQRRQRQIEAAIRPVM